MKLKRSDITNVPERFSRKNWKKTPQIFGLSDSDSFAQSHAKSECNEFKTDCTYARL